MQNQIADKYIPWLENMRVATPCKALWANMEGDELKRRCSECHKSVYNISKLSKKEAEAFLRENGISKCVTYYQRKDGTILTDDCPVGLRRLRDGARKMARIAATIIGFCVSFSAALAKGENPVFTINKPLFIVNDSPDVMGRWVANIHPILPPYSVLTTGAHSLSADELSQSNDKTLLYLIERDHQVGIGIKVGNTYSAGTSVIELNPNLLAEQVFAQAKQHEEANKLSTAESLYKLTIKYFSYYQPSWGYDESFIKTAVSRYAKLLTKLNRSSEADSLLTEFCLWDQSRMTLQKPSSPREFNAAANL